MLLLRLRHAFDTYSYIARGALVRAIDLILVSVSISVALPLMVVSAALIKLSSPGPVLLRLACLDCSGREFKQLRFRVVYADAAARAFRAKAEMGTAAEVRVTAIGQFLLDSGMNRLPQLWNVFRGQMTFFGPRAVAANDNSKIVCLRKPGMFRLYRTANLAR